jgi:L-arabonate dehydrase
VNGSVSTESPFDVMIGAGAARSPVDCRNSLYKQALTVSGRRIGENVRLPPKILQRGITDMVRISDARMSGTAYGTVVLHVAPEAAVGGPLALVEEGDWIVLDVDRRRLNLEVDEATLAQRRAGWTSPGAPKRGYAKLYVDHVLQADQGVDLDFLVGGSGTEVLRDSH